MYGHALFSCISYTSSDPIVPKEVSQLFIKNDKFMSPLTLALLTQPSLIPFMYYIGQLNIHVYLSVVVSLSKPIGRYKQ